MTKEKKYDFSGWATRNDIRCSDRRIIRKNSFKEQDGEIVPLVWNHDHQNMKSVLGHCLLENRDEGVYAYCSFNETDLAKNAKEMVKHGDIRALSIYANQLKQNGDDVVHGKIREVSLVLAGANMGAYIDTVVVHSDIQEEEAIIFHAYEENDIELYHEESKEKHKEDKKMADPNEQKKEKTVEDIFNEMTEEQQEAVYAIVGAALEAEDKDETNKEDKEKMKHNLFEGQKNLQEDFDTLQHSALLEIKQIAKRNGGSVREAVNEYMAHNLANNKNDELAHSITNVGYLFPDYKDVLPEPDMISRDNTWVGAVMNKVKHTPFARVRSRHIDITGSDARARGFVKGNLKAEEVVVALKRTTDPQTIYKKQAMDRDDLIDITDFNATAWLKSEMRYMLDEEIARAILIGDGRSSDSNDKIDPTHIRPILGDTSVYTVAKSISKVTNETDSAFYKRLIREIIKARKDYKGSGNPDFYTTEDVLSGMLLIEDGNGRVIYDTVEKLATALRVNGIYTVEPMEGATRTSEGYDYTCLGIIVNLTDYNVGADKGGKVSMFDDFDIDYNKEKYLIETRCSGALTKPYSAITFELKETHVEG